MILSRTSQYAVQALIFIATRPRGEPVLNREIASYLGVPPDYLAKNNAKSVQGRLALFRQRGQNRPNVELARWSTQDQI